MKKPWVLIAAMLLPGVAPFLAAAGSQPQNAYTAEATIARPEGPFALPSDALVDQPVTLELVGLASYDSTTDNNLDIFTADDFTSKQGWVVRNFFVPTLHFLSDMSCVDSLTWQVYRDVGGMPDGDPAGGGNAPLWGITLPFRDPQMSVGYHSVIGTFTTVRVDLQEPFYLPAGDYWLVFYTTQNTDLCRFTYRSPASTVNGYEAVVMKPSAVSFPAVWTPVSRTTWNEFRFNDFAFRIGGEACPGGLYDPGDGRLSIPEVMMDDSDTCYEADLSRSGEDFEFSVASAGKVPCTCPSATYTSATGILAISSLQVVGVPKTYNVELTRAVGSWVFDLSKVSR